MQTRGTQDLLEGRSIPAVLQLRVSWVQLPIQAEDVVELVCPCLTKDGVKVAVIRDSNPEGRGADLTSKSQAVAHIAEVEGECRDPEVRIQCLPDRRQGFVHGGRTDGHVGGAGTRDDFRSRAAVGRHEHSPCRFGKVARPDDAASRSSTAARGKLSSVVVISAVGRLADNADRGATDVPAWRCRAGCRTFVLVSAPRTQTPGRSSNVPQRLP